MKTSLTPMGENWESFVEHVSLSAMKIVNKKSINVWLSVWQTRYQRNTCKALPERLSRWKLVMIRFHWSFFYLCLMFDKWIISGIHMLASKNVNGKEIFYNFEYTTSFINRLVLLELNRSQYVKWRTTSRQICLKIFSDQKWFFCIWTLHQLWPHMNIISNKTKSVVFIDRGKWKMSNKQ